MLGLASLAATSVITTIQRKMSRDLPREMSQLKCICEMHIAHDLYDMLSARGSISQQHLQHINIEMPYDCRPTSSKFGAYGSPLRQMQSTSTLLMQTLAKQQVGYLQVPLRPGDGSPAALAGSKQLMPPQPFTVLMEDGLQRQPPVHPAWLVTLMLMAVTPRIGR